MACFVVPTSSILKFEGGPCDDYESEGALPAFLLIALGVSSAVVWNVAFIVVACLRS